MSDAPRPINSELLERIIRKSAKRLVMLGIENEADLLEMIHRKAAALQDKPGGRDLVVSFSHKITVNFTKGRQTDLLGGTMKVALEIEGDLDDPDQDELDFGEEAES